MAQNNTVDSYIDMVGEYFKKLPELPKGGKDAIVTITPWLALIFGVLGVVTALVGLGIFTFLAPIVMISGANGAGTGFVVVLFGLVSSALLLAAFPGTKAKKMQGWKLLYYSEVVGLIANIVSLALAGVLFTLIGFYFLYQIRSYYTK
ncbi:MAG: hypothetical protein Q7T54_02875 [Candidatus Levybacteria bacterium]|nr:hypothetical protein [Candidatus Levybacteria bacterium]